MESPVSWSSTWSPSDPFLALSLFSVSQGSRPLKTTFPRFPYSPASCQVQPMGGRSGSLEVEKEKAGDFSPFLCCRQWPAPWVQLPPGIHSGSHDPCLVTPFLGCGHTLLPLPCQPSSLQLLFVGSFYLLHCPPSALLAP